MAASIGGPSLLSMGSVPPQQFPSRFRPGRRLAGRQAAGRTTSLDFGSRPTSSHKQFAFLLEGQRPERLDLFLELGDCSHQEVVHQFRRFVGIEKGPVRPVRGPVGVASSYDRMRVRSTPGRSVSSVLIWLVLNDQPWRDVIRLWLRVCRDDQRWRRTSSAECRRSSPRRAAVQKTCPK